MRRLRPARADGRVLSGPDIGFRIEGQDARTGNPTGTWVVRVDGQWLPVGSAPAVHPAR